MPALTTDSVRTLARFRGQAAPVTTCYLDVDGRRFPRHQDYVHQLDVLLRRARSEQDGHISDGHQSVHADLERIEHHIRAGIDRSHVRGVAMFSCSAEGFWTVIELPVRVSSQVVVEAAPHVRQLESVLDEYERFGVVLADSHRARVFLFELGELVEHTELLDAAEEVRHQHLRHAADVAFRLFQDTPFEHLVVGAPPDVAAELVACLHPYLRSRLVERLTLSVQSTEDQVRRAALDVERTVERRKEQALVRRLRDAVGAGRRGVGGLEPTLRALAERRVEHLVVSQGYRAPGWQCVPCGHLACIGRRCPLCLGSMEQTSDVVEHAIEQAVSHGCRVEMCVENADLDVLGGIGALLRY
jgi:peptide chain release factor subunit 1